MRWRKSAIDGTFGDKTVLLTTGVIDRPRKAALLFHGVHSSSGSDPGNKYARIGAALAENGVMPILCETSRRVRNRHDYTDRPLEWIIDAFRGKTYLNELEDCYLAYLAVKTIYPLLPLTLWGFSLGGLSALLIAGGAASGTNQPEKLDGLILCGSGDKVFAENKDIFKLPILSTAQEGSEQLTAAGNNLRVNWARVFRGSEDTTFPHDACVRVYESLSTADKAFYEVPGSDHSFRLLHGSPSHVPLEEVFKRVPQLFASE
ncbi:MAG: alpha/beta hydrolase [Pyramidobacter sp.]|nr:alpha/beta hydrolase [Pyramidobacter sp.]